MTVSLNHTFVSAKADGSDSTLVQPSHWNANHTITMAAGKILGRDASGAGTVQELSMSFAATGDATMGSTGYFTFPSGTTAQRPSTPAAGMVRYNTDTSKLEGYLAGAWGAVNASVVISTTAPTSPVNNDLWFNSSSSVLSVYSAGSWVATSASVAWGAITGKPTTIAGYGITDGIAYLGTSNYFTADQAINKSSPILYLNGPVGGNRQLVGSVGFSARWNLLMGDTAAETGGNAGSDFALWSYTDAGVGIGPRMSIRRSDGAMNFGSTGYVAANTINAKGFYIDGVAIGNASPHTTLLTAASGTFTANANHKYCVVTVIGGGGGGIGGTGGIAGAAGGLARKTMVLTPSTGYSYSVGAGALASAGGTTTFSGSSTISASGGGAGGSGGTGTGGDINLQGGAGSFEVAISTSFGGMAPLGYSGVPIGSLAQGYGSGGGGSSSTNYSGRQGCIEIVEWY
ncbi:MAG: hypothetical protein KGL39_55235 [Patescibacteria group bacterium]|nr:hypothetical protein [Patescibacteria group bacterium]